jgi:type IV pilus assembly protein PilB
MMKNFRKVVNKQLGEILVERGIINRAQLESALSIQREQNLLLGEALVSLKHTTEEHIVQALTSQYGFPYLPLSNYEISPEVLSSVPVAICVKYCLIPIDRIGKSLTLAMSNPLNLSALEEVESESHCMVQAFVSTATDIKAAIKRYYELA